MLQEHKEYFLGLGIYNHVLLQIALFTKIINGINLLIYFTLDVIEYVIEEVTADRSLRKVTMESSRLDSNWFQLTSGSNLVWQGQMSSWSPDEDRLLPNWQEVSSTEFSPW